MADEKNLIPNENHGDIVIYQTEDGGTKIDVRFVDETVWLTQAQLCELYQTGKSNVSEHIKHIFEEGELEENSVVRKFRTTAADGKQYNVTYYNLDMIISLGYRIKSKIATSVDYDPKSSESVAFFKMVQNKLHYAAHGHTAAEVIYERADADKPFMGLTAFSGDFPMAKDIGIAKNYLTEEELRILNGIVSGYFDFAEVQAIRHRPIHMSDYVAHLDSILSSTGEQLLIGAGKVSHKQAMDKANREYQRFLVQNLSPVEEAYLQTIKEVEKTAKKKAKED